MFDCFLTGWTNKNTLLNTIEQKCRIYLLHSMIRIKIRSKYNIQCIKKLYFYCSHCAQAPFEIYVHLLFTVYWSLAMRILTSR